MLNEAKPSKPRPNFGLEREQGLIDAILATRPP